MTAPVGNNVKIDGTDYPAAYDAANDTITVTAPKSATLNGDLEISDDLLSEWRHDTTWARPATKDLKVVRTDGTVSKDVVSITDGNPAADGWQLPAKTTVASAGEAAPPPPPAPAAATGDKFESRAKQEIAKADAKFLKGVEKAAEEADGANTKLEKAGVTKIEARKEVEEAKQKLADFRRDSSHQIRDGHEAEDIQKLTEDQKEELHDRENDLLNAVKDYTEEVGERRTEIESEYKQAKADSASTEVDTKADGLRVLASVEKPYETSTASGTRLLKALASAMVARKEATGESAERVSFGSQSFALQSAEGAEPAFAPAGDEASGIVGATEELHKISDFGNALTNASYGMQDAAFSLMGVGGPFGAMTGVGDVYGSLGSARSAAAMARRNIKSIEGFILFLQIASLEAERHATRALGAIAKGVENINKSLESLGKELERTAGRSVANDVDAGNRLQAAMQRIMMRVQSSNTLLNVETSLGREVIQGPQIITNTLKSIQDVVYANVLMNTRFQQ